MQAGRQRWAARFALCATLRLTSHIWPIQLGKRQGALSICLRFSTLLMSTWTVLLPEPG